MTDDKIGQILKFLKENNLEKNTMVIFTSDNGCSPSADFKTLREMGHDPSAGFRGTKADIYEGGHRIPFIVKWPGVVQPGSKNNTTICLTDFMATCSDLLNMPLQSNSIQDSYSLLPLLSKSKTHEYKRTSTIHHSIDGYFAIRKGDWKLAFCRGSGGWSAPTENQAIKDNLPAIQLFNLKDDLSEQKNVQDQYPAIVSALTTELEKIKTGNTEKSILYKNIDSTSLYLTIYPSLLANSNQKPPAMVFFFGGGWTSGTIKQFEPQANYFSKRGITCILVDYRVRDKHNTTPFESLKDAKSAIRFVREHANELNIDPLKIIAAGGSAGGHLAAATALITDYNESTDNLSISCIPNALILFNPVFDNGPGGYGYERIRDAYKNFSPLHNIKVGAPPTVVFLGEKDDLVAVETARYYKKVMEKVKSRCDLFLYEGQGHGFFNYTNFEFYKKTVTETDTFLQSLGYLRIEPVVEIK